MSSEVVWKITQLDSRAWPSRNASCPQVANTWCTALPEYDMRNTNR